MKKKLGWIISIVSINIALIYFVVINISFNKVPELIDISGDRGNLDGIEISVVKANDRYTTTLFNISNHRAEKEKTSYDWRLISNNFAKEDKKFYGDVSNRFDEIYEGEDSRFAASFSNERNDNLGKSYITIDYRNKKTNDYIEFTKEVSRRDTIYGVYSEGDSQKIIIETSGQYGTGEIAILDVNLETEEITTEYEINLKDLFDIDKVSYIDRGETNGQWNSMVYNGKLHLITEKEFELSGAISIDIKNGSAEFYEFKDIGDEIWERRAVSAYENKIYFGYIDNVSNVSKIAIFDMDSNTFKRYEDIKFSKELDEIWKLGNIDNMRLYDDKLVLSYTNWLGTNNYRGLINVIDINNNESLYLGELTDCRVINLK